MKVCILGNGLTSLALAQSLVNQDIEVDIFEDKKIKKYDKIQTLAISKTNIDFFNKNILNIEKLLWNVHKIEIFSENLKDEKILSFKKNNDQIFSMIRNSDLYNHLLVNLKKNKLVNFRKKINYNNLIKIDYKLIFNCDFQNFITKKFFYKKIDKNYNSFAYITTFSHNKLLNNRIASQFFTKDGPLAFLPISATETSVVYSVRGKRKINLEDIIKKYNDKLKILRIEKIIKFELKSTNLRSYYHDNIIAFGDLLHRLHPFAGQGFNMILRDIKMVFSLVKFNLELGLNFDKSFCYEFEKKTKNKNFIFSSGIDFIYEFFKIESKINNNVLSKSIKALGKNKIVNNFFTKFADNGIIL